MRVIYIVAALLFFVKSGSAFGNSCLDIKIGPSVRGEVLQLIIEDLSFLSVITGVEASEEHAFHFSTKRVDGQDYCRYINEGVESIQFFENDPELKWSPAIFEDGILFINDYYKELPRIVRVSIILHEASHASGTKYEHVRCPTPFKDPFGHDVVTVSGMALAGKPACDSSKESAYGLQLAWLEAIAKYCTNCSPNDIQIANEAIKRLQNRLIIKNDLIRSSIGHCE